MNINSLGNSYFQTYSHRIEEVSHVEELEYSDQVLLEAVEVNDLEKVEKLLVKFVYPFDNKIKCLESCLLHAVENNNLELLKLLLKINSSKGYLIDPFINAIKQGNKEIVQLFLDKSADLIKQKPADFSYQSENLSGYALSPILIAIDVEQYEIAKLLLNHCSSFSFDFAFFDLALKKESEELVQLLIKRGVLISRERVALNLAAKIKNYNIAKIIIDNVHVHFFDFKDYSTGLTPLETACNYKNKEFIQAMLSVSPDFVKQFFNNPSEKGVTRIQQLARDGSIEMLNFLLPYFTDEEVILNSEAHFTERDLQACKAQPTSLENIPIDEIAFPLTVAQNFCHVMIKLTNGQILKIPNADAKQIHSFLMKKKFGVEASEQESTNVLTVYVSPGHGFLRLNCKSCDNGCSFDESQGFYPKGDDYIHPKRFGEERTKGLGNNPEEIVFLKHMYYASGGWLYENIFIPAAEFHQAVSSDQLGYSISEDDYESRSEK